MFVRLRDRENGNISVQIVESKRQGSKVLQKVLRTVGLATNKEEAAEFERVAQTFILNSKLSKQPLLPNINCSLFLTPDKRVEIEDKVQVKNLRKVSKIADGVSDIFGAVYKEVGFENIVTGTRRDDQWNALLKASVLSRIVEPGSKRRSVSVLENSFGANIKLEKIYRMLDHVYKNIGKIKEITCNSTRTLFKHQVDVLFFDVTTLYFESITADELKDFGFSKDCKFKEVQVVLALVTTERGHPLTYEVFPGNMHEGHTFIKMIEELENKFNIKKVMFVADRAMFNKKNLDAMDERGIKYIVAAKLRSLSKNLKNQILDSKTFKLTLVGEEASWANEFLYQDRRLIVSYSSARAKRDASQRQRLIDRLIKKVKNGTVKLSDIIPNYGTKKFINLNGQKTSIDESKIEADAKWDGLHGVITNDAEGTTSTLLARYRELWQIEEAFRVNKHDLKMRPIYHWTPSRIRSHVSICFMTYTLVKIALYRLSQNNLNHSFEEFKNILTEIDSTIVEDKSTRIKYSIPSLLTDEQKKIYKCFEIEYSDRPYRTN